MPNYRVAVDSVTGKRGKVFYRGDSVTEQQFDNAAQLSRLGFLEEFIVMEEQEIEMLPKLEEVKREYLMDRLKKAGIQFSANSSKVELYEKWKILMRG